jgi:hypothetical protein
MSVESAPLAITDGVDRLFCSRSSARYGPHKRQDEGSVIAPGVLYRYRVLNEADRPLALQLFAGLGRLGGPLWEQEVRVLLRVSAATHPALPRVVDGGYDEAADVAFVGTETTTYTLDSPGALAFLHERRAECVRRSLSSSVRQMGREFSERPPRCRLAC